MEDRAVEHVGPWRLERLLGQGGMARVYLASGPGGPVAVKWLYRANAALLARFAEEARVLERLDHVGVVRYRGHGVERGLPWMAMEYIEGQDLRAYTQKLRLRPPAERQARAREIARAVCRALAYVHEQGVIHRDIKPSNILLEARGRTVVADFGVAAATDDLADKGGLVGTAAYAAPEQLLGRRVDARVDQYGLGCTLYFLLTGRRPFEDLDTAALLHAHLERAPRPPSELDPTVDADLEAFVLRLMAKDPDARFPNMAAAEASIASAAPEGLPLAGRQSTIDGIAHALDRVATGAGVVLRLVGQRGSGRSWMQALARDAADRRGLHCVATDDAHALDAAVQRVRHGEPLLVVTTRPVPEAEELALPPLAIAELRRSAYAHAPQTPDLARVAERLHRESGGTPALLLDLLGRYTTNGRIVLPDGPLTVDAARFLDGMDLDEMAVAGALSALPPVPLEVATIEAVAQVPAEAALAALRDRGVAAGVDHRWTLSAEALRGPLRALVPDPEAMAVRVAALLDQPSEVVADPVLVEVDALKARGARRDAITLLESALHDEDHRGGRLLALGALLWGEGDAWAANRIYGEALELLTEPETRQVARLGLGVTALQGGALRVALDRLGELAEEASVARDARLASAALLHLAEAQAMSGLLATSVATARRALSLAESLRDRPLECAAVRHLGMVLLDAGFPSEAGRHLADASALARAADLPEERIAAQVLRARASLEDARRPDQRTAAAAAIDRVLPQLTAAGDDRGGFRLLGRCVWAHAAAVLGDHRMYRRASEGADPSAMSGRACMRMRALVLLSRAALVAGDSARAEELASVVLAEATERGFVLFGWEASRLLARARGEPLPPPGALTDGLPDAAIGAISAR